MSRPSSGLRSRASVLRAGWARWGRLVAVVAALGPLPLLAVHAPQRLRIQPLEARPAGPPPAVFSHWAHDRLGCYACHPGIFPQAPQGFTHQQMQAGRACGACHDGRGAQAVSALRCEDCHVAR
jgi:c(7)-type cytochrome triheme protein